VFKNNATVSGTLSSMRENLTDFTDYSTEQQFGIQLTLREAESAPQDFISLYLPLCSYAENSAAIGNDNALVVSRAFRAGIPSVTGTAGSTLFVCTSGTT
jgi:hypothetical protein